MILIVNNHAKGRCARRIINSQFTIMPEADVPLAHWQLVAQHHVILKINCQLIITPKANVPLASLTIVNHVRGRCARRIANENKSLNALA